MNCVEIVRDGFKNYLDEVEIGDSIYDLKMDFLCDLLNVTTYDNNLSREIGTDIVEVLEVINNGNNFNYIEQDKDNYKKFIIVCNLLDHNNWIEWGTSIRGCWLNDELNIDGLYGMENKLIFKDKQEVNNLINYLKSNEI